MTAQGFHPHIIVHTKQGVFEVSTGEAVLRDLADAAILHVAAEQPGQHHTDLRLALAAVAFNDHHALALVAGDQAVYALTNLTPASPTVHSKQ